MTGRGSYSFPLSALKFQATSSCEFMTQRTQFGNNLYTRTFSSEDPVGALVGVAVSIQLWYRRGAERGEGSMPTQNWTAGYFLCQRVGICACHSGPIYISGFIRWRIFSGHRTTKEQVGSKKELEKWHSQNPALWFSASLLDSRTGLWWTLTPASPPNNLILFLND